MQKPMVAIEDQFEDAPDETNFTSSSSLSCPLSSASEKSKTIASITEQGIAEGKQFDNASAQPLMLLSSLATNTLSWRVACTEVDGLNTHHRNGPTPTPAQVKLIATVTASDLATMLQSSSSQLMELRQAIQPSTTTIARTATKKRVYPKPILVPQPQQTSRQLLLLAPRPDPNLQNNNERHALPWYPKYNSEIHTTLIVPVLGQQPASAPSMSNQYPRSELLQPHHMDTIHTGESLCRKRLRLEDTFTTNEKASKEDKSCRTLTTNRILPCRVQRAKKFNSSTIDPETTVALRITASTTNTIENLLLSSDGNQPPDRTKGASQNVPPRLERTVLGHPMAFLIPGSSKWTPLWLLPDVPEDKVRSILIPYHDIQDDDILVGRGATSNNHVGNRLYRALISKYRLVYMNLAKGFKLLLARSICNYVRVHWGSRFLMYERRASVQGWFECGDARAHKKCSQALREEI